MAEPIKINGRGYDFGSITPKLPGGQTLLGFKSISYDDSCATELQYANGRTPVAYGQGNYEAKGELEVLSQYADEFEAAVDPNNNGFYSHKPFPLTVSYGNSDSPLRTDQLLDVKITERSGGGGKQGDTELVRKYAFLVCGGIHFNGRKPI